MASIFFFLAATIIIFFCEIHAYPQNHKITKLPDQPNVDFQQYSGFISVDDYQQRSLFYYFAECEFHPNSKPLVLWLNGGPGCSSVGFGAFIEHGPFQPTSHGLAKNKYSWNKEANMLYLESPAGVGFSFSSNTSFYNYVDDEMAAQDNLVFLHHWLDMFPEYKERDLLITGESYGGHYVPQLAQLIQRSSLQMNLKGVAMGNPLMDFNSDYNSRAQYFWSHSMISDHTYEMLQTVCNYSTIQRQSRVGVLTPECAIVTSRFKSEIGPWLNTYDVTLDICLPWNNSQSYFSDNIGSSPLIDLCEEDRTTIYLNRKDVQQALHARLMNNWFLCSSVLHYDMRSVEVTTTDILGSLIKSGIRVMVFSGDQDSVIPTIGTRRLVNGLAKKLGLNETVAYRSWAQGQQAGGWTQVYGDLLVLAVIRGAGHEAAYTQPERSLAVFKAFVDWKNLPIINDTSTTPTKNRRYTTRLDP